MQIDVTCASSSKVGAIPAGARTLAVRTDMSTQEMTHVIETAAAIARATNEAVYLTR